MNKKILTVTLAALIALSGCTDNSTTHEHEKNTQNQMINEFSKDVPNDAPVLNVTTDDTYPPFAFRDEYGNIIGFDVDIINAVAADQSMKVVLRPSSWDKAFTNIEAPNNKSTELVIGAMRYTPERQLKYELTNSYTEALPAIAVLKDSPIQSITDLTNKKVGLVKGGFAFNTLKTNGIVSYTPEELSTTYLLFKNLVQQNVDVVIDDETALKYHAKNHPDFPVRFIEVPGQSGATVIATNKGNVELVHKLNQGIANIHKNGVYDKIYAKWLGAKTESQAPVSASQPEQHSH